MKLAIGATHFGVDEILGGRWQDQPGLSANALAALAFTQSWLRGDDAFAVQTSGSTGDPKPIRLTRRQMEASARATGAALGLACVAIGATEVFAQAAAAPAAAAAPVPNKGDTAWLLVSSLLVLMMSIPGLALFYGGLVRSKNMLSVLTQVMAIVSMVGLLWCFYGYSISLGDGGGYYLGGFGKAFLKGIDANSVSATFSNGVVVPEFAYMVFQMTFAMITPALIVGAFAERMKFSAVLLFVVLWFTFAYLPMAHMVWFWACLLYTSPSPRDS